MFRRRAANFLFQLVCSSIQRTTSLSARSAANSPTCLNDANSAGREGGDGSEYAAAGRIFASVASFPSGGIRVVEAGWRVGRGTGRKRSRSLDAGTNELEQKIGCAPPEHQLQSAVEQNKEMADAPAAGHVDGRATK